MYFKGKMTQVALYDGSLSLRDKTKQLTKENINEFSADIKIINDRDEVMLYQFENLFLFDLASDLTNLIRCLDEIKSELGYEYHNYYKVTKNMISNSNAGFEWLIVYNHIVGINGFDENKELLNIYISCIDCCNSNRKTARIDLLIYEVEDFCNFINNFATESPKIKPNKKYSTKGKVHWITLMDFSNYLGEVYLDQVDGEDVIMVEGYKHIFDDNERHYFEALQKVSFKEIEIQYLHEADSKNELNYYKMRSKLVKLN